MEKIEQVFIHEQIYACTYNIQRISGYHLEHDGIHYVEGGRISKGKINSETRMNLGGQDESPK